MKIVIWKGCVILKEIEVEDATEVNIDPTGKVGFAGNGLDGHADTLFWWK